MFRGLGILSVCLAMFSIAGGHWAVLQSIAWAGMLRDFARTDGIVRAAEKTFDGEHPCAMCKRIAEKKSGEQKQAPLAKSEHKSDKLIAQRAAPGLFPPRHCRLLAIPPADRPASFLPEPPSPVPRAA